MKQEQILFSLENITVRVRDRHILRNTSWTFRRGEQWAVIGPNGSGKTSLVRSLIDEYTVIAGKIRKSEYLETPEAIGFVSFEQQQGLYDFEQRKYRNYCYSGNAQAIPTAGELVSQEFPSGTNKRLRALAGNLRIEHILGRKATALSTGETRKLLILRALYREPELLILDEPFEGLDPSSRKSLSAMISAIISDGSCHVVLVTHHRGHILPEITHAIWVEGLYVKAQGVLEHVLRTVEHRSSKKMKPSIRAEIPQHSPDRHKTETLIFNNLAIRFDDTVVFSRFNWKVMKGENWLIVGPNGSGKSTLLGCITGEVSQVYGQDVWLFGRRKGSGESLWEIRRNLSWISAGFHLAYRKDVSCLDTVLSGFFDSVGVYRSCTHAQINRAETWLMNIGLYHRKDDPFGHLSFGEQTLVLLARAMVKQPELLILDEPLQGLDTENRSLLISYIEDLAAAFDRTILCVTHHPELFSSRLFRTLDLGS